ncbi:DUF305 domain-containing protein [Cypionkella sp.]|uniref:DUF305 domain-containing protein n=1 Tax=Cypionkella sp. TaxID=2811411 RepID=UPI00272628C9|nr:DUF305 domain-containing protein [Cypionkella sp.]MDO8986438.1 DUF305 domain-containing protein [Cypionkella sp.]MDP2048221.1 DUF305 domain-containing protein [Cypionkella sp.]
MKTTTTTLILAAALSLVGGLAFADSHDKMQAMSDAGMKPFMAPMDTMMTAMPMMSTGKPDADFLLMMIPHHQSAIDMAKVELQMGKDEATKAMAQKIIDAQVAEIAEMKDMLKAMGVEAPM